MVLEDNIIITDVPSGYKEESPNETSESISPIPELFDDFKEKVKISPQGLETLSFDQWLPFFYSLLELEKS